MRLYRARRGTISFYCDALFVSDKLIEIPFYDEEIESQPSYLYKTMRFSRGGIHIYTWRILKRPVWLS